MKENELKNFVDSTLSYFQNATGEAATMGIPFVKTAADDIYSEFTGIIGISGERKGAIYVTCGEGLLTDLAKIVTGIKDNIDPALVRDMAGELANTISGNATKAFGRNFNISVPVIFEGKPKSINLKIEPPCFVIPTTWRGHKLHVAVGITD
ncbi:MAG: chemotaxis protein CheX [Spirochaetes bacterium]|nr:chemotaxis protein CheX [Spirochaetota bacterium]